MRDTRNCKKGVLFNEETNCLDQSVVNERNTTTGVLISPYPDQEGNKLGSMSGTRAISTTSRRVLSSFFLPARQGDEGNSPHSDRNISLFPSWSG